MSYYNMLELKHNLGYLILKRIICCRFKDISDAILGVALVGGQGATASNPSGLRVSFAASSVDAERKKNEKDKKMTVVGNDDPL